MSSTIYSNDLSFNKRSTDSCIGNHVDTDNYIGSINVKGVKDNGCKDNGGKDNGVKDNGANKDITIHYQTNKINNGDQITFGQSDASSTIYLLSLQTNEKVELYRINKNNRECVTKCSKIGSDGYVCPRFLREISILKRISNPPKHLAKHPGRKNIIKLFDTYTKNNVLHFDMEAADGTLQELKEIFNINIIREHILRDVSRGLQYLHELGYNHGDLSHNNIVYFLKIPLVELIAMMADPLLFTEAKLKLKRIFRFALIDFGNSIHMHRPLSLEISTCYAMAPEILNASMLIHEIEHIVQCTRIEKHTFETVGDKIEKLKKNITHKKSDIWCLGALSFYLHTYDHFAHENTIEKQAEQVSKKYAINYLNGLDKAYGKKYILKKTKDMMKSDHIDRSTIYFNTLKMSTPFLPDNTKNQQVGESQEINKPNNLLTNDTSKKTNSLPTLKKYSRVDKNFAIYMDMFADVINGVAVRNKRYYYLNVLDLQSKYDIVEHCYDIEKRYIVKILELVNNHNDNLINLQISNSKMSIIHTIIIWLVSHMYINYTWTVAEVALYFMRAGIVSNKKRNLIVELTTTIAGIILKAIDWNFDNDN